MSDELGPRTGKAGAIVVSLSGGKDSVAMLLDLVERGLLPVACHYQCLPEDWRETLPYVQYVCEKVGVPLVAQQILYEPVGDGTGVRRLAVVDIHKPGDIVPWNTPGVIAGVTDLAMRRGWPPSASARFCTRYGKVELLDLWLRQNRSSLLAEQPEIWVALGERAAESPRRARKTATAPRLHWKREQVTAVNWLPVHTWSRRDTFRKLRDWGIEPHPAYQAQGMSPASMYDADVEGGARTSCRFCIYASQAERCHQAQSEACRPVLDRLVEFERATGRTWWATMAASSLLAGEPGRQLAFDW
ncbi:MAG: hypothetical protein JW850_18505 [Thermoflexales bacterium]|nr:hypothetical protein [Thermoflexales bacterium]